MPYQPTQPLIVAMEDEAGRHYSYHERLPQNGTRLRRGDGLLLSEQHNPRDNIILYARQTQNGSLAGAIKDEALVKRINEYLTLYYGRRYTNCSAFAHFLFTGEFVECEEELNLAVVHHHMQHYRNVRRVEVGDMLGVIYIRQRLAQSRKTPWRRNYLEARKRRHNEGACLTRGLRTIEPVMPPGEILELCKNPAMVDYHFMVCVDHKVGKPVWLSQLGRNEGSDDYAPLAITHGNEDLLPLHTPLLTLIKRRK